MTSALVAGVVFAGLLLAALPLGRALALRRRLDEAERTRLARGLDVITFDEGSRFVTRDDGTLVRAPDAVPEGAVELGAAVAGLLVGGVVLGLPTGLLGVGAGLLPAGFRLVRERRESRAITAALPGALDVVSAAIRVGHGFAASLRLAAAETVEPLRGELVRAADEVELGLPVRDAVGGLVERHPSCLELRLFASAVVFQRQAGGNLVELLEQLAASVRDRAMFEAKARSITAEVRNSTNVLGAIPAVAGLAMVLFVPDHFEPMLRSSVGQALLTCAVLAVLVGTTIVHGLARTLEP